MSLSNFYDKICLDAEAPLLTLFNLNRASESFRGETYSIAIKANINIDIHSTR